MPHIHMLLILDKNAQITLPEQVDEYICARVPALPPLDDLSPEANQQRRLWYYVTTMMMHDCNQACKETVMINDEPRYICRKHFPKPYSDFTEISGIFIYIFLIFSFRSSLHQLRSIRPR